MRANDPSADPPPPDFDPLTEEGAAELRRRIEGAPPRGIPRAELDGHLGLSSRELYELGVTVAPIGLRGVPSAVGGRILVVIAAVVGTFLLALAASALLDPVLAAVLGEEVRRDTVDDGVESGIGLAVFLGLPGVGVVALAGFGVRRIRRGVAARRASVGTAAPAAEDPEARATVAVVREPGALRVSLLWVRADPEDASRLEARFLVDERIPEDEPGRAEDAVGRLAEIALRADAGRAVPWDARGSGIGAAAARGDQARSDAARGGGAAPDAARDDRALVAAAEASLPAVDPDEPVGAGWDPRPLTDAGRAELAARLVRARPVLWNPAELERMAVDARARRPHRPEAWPTDAERLAPLAPAMTTWERRSTLGFAWVMFAIWVGTLAGIARADDPASLRMVAYPALAFALVAATSVRGYERTAPGRRLLRTVRAAARLPARSLGRGILGPAGQVLVLHGTRGGRDRVELVHARVVDDDRDRLQVRTIAWRELDPGTAEDPREVVQELWAIGDDAGFVTRRGERDAGAVQRINAALGRAAARRRALGLRREPLAWTAAPLIALFALLVLVVLDRDGDSDGLALDVALTCWPLLAAIVLWRAARRVRDPVGAERSARPADAPRPS